MVSRSLLLVLLVLACLQSFSTAYSGTEPGQCCFSFQTHQIPVRLITAYKVTEIRCANPGVILTLQSGRRVCADPGVEWVQNRMEKIDQRLIPQA